MFYYAINYFGVKPDVFLKDFAIFLFCLEVNRVDPLKYLVGCFVCANLKFVRLASFG